MNNLVESIAIKDGVILNLEWHEKRYQASYAEYFAKKSAHSLFDNLKLDLPTKGYYKLRIEYSEYERKTEFQPYSIKSIDSLKIVEDDYIDYHLKSTDRKRLNELFAQRADGDDILIIKNGLVTDTWAGNIIFYDGKEWFTPDSPLLKGTQRARLLAEGKINEYTIYREDIMGFVGFQVINAMRPMIANHFTTIDNIIS